MRVGQMQFRPITFGEISDFQFDPKHGPRPQIANEHIFTARSQIAGQTFDVNGRVEPPIAPNRNLMVRATFVPTNQGPEITAWTPNIGDDKNSVNTRSNGAISPPLAEGLQRDTLELRRQCLEKLPALAEASFR